MIEKLDKFDSTEASIYHVEKLYAKVNQLVDVVNGLQESMDLVQSTLVAEPEKRETPAENVLTKALRMDKEFAEDECARLQDELDRTRKALDVALDWLKQVATPDKCDDDLCREFTKRKLAEIKTSLEQKESEFVHNKIKFPEYNDNLLEEFDKQFFENGQDDDLTETALEQKDVK